MQINWEWVRSVLAVLVAALLVWVGTRLIQVEGVALTQSTQAKLLDEVRDEIGLVTSEVRSLREFLDIQETQQEERHKNLIVGIVKVFEREGLDIDSSFWELVASHDLRLIEMLYADGHISLERFAALESRGPIEMARPAPEQKQQEAPRAQEPDDGQG